MVICVSFSIIVPKKIPISAIYISTNVFRDFEPYHSVPRSFCPIMRLISSKFPLVLCYQYLGIKCMYHGVCCGYSKDVHNFLPVSLLMPLKIWILDLL